MKRIRLVFSLLASFFAAYSQPAGWEHLDIQHDHFFGMSTTKAFRELLQGKKASDVLVAVIDGGIDTAHPALRPVLWTNQREIPGNGIDDDGNGYIDDIHGWSFTNFPVARQRLAEIIREKKDFFDSLSYTGVPPQLRRDYQEYRRLLAIYDLSARQIQGALSRLENLAKQLDTLAAATGKPNPTTMDFERLKEDSGRDRKMLDALLRQMKGYADFRTFYDATITQKKIRLAYGLAHLTTKEDSGHIAASFIENNADVSYDAAFSSLNNQSMESITYQPLACHGTHVAGIIAASGGGSSDVRGVAEHVKIMCLKVVSSLYSNCSEQVLADAIRYAVDNGARIINLSLGAPAFSGKKPLDSAIKYAMQKNVLIIHAAGNNGIDLDKENTAISFSKTYSDGSGQAEAWIEVGASGWKDSIGLAAVFSNYGKNTVDVFAPGDSITSTIPGRTYDSYSGTSMAAPMVAGLAALIMEYYPRLTALQVRDIILHSVAPVKHTVELPGSMERQHRVPFSELCATGGIVNAYNALKLASHYSGVNK